LLHALQEIPDPRPCADPTVTRQPEWVSGLQPERSKLRFWPHQPLPEPCCRRLARNQPVVANPQRRSLESINGFDRQLQRPIDAGWGDSYLSRLLGPIPD